MRLIILLLLLLIHSQVLGQVILRGEVKDEYNKPLPFVNIALLQKQDSSLFRGSFSDQRGRFEIRDVPDNQYVISASMIGYQTVQQPLTIDGNFNYDDFILIEMQQSDQSLDEVTIEAERPYIEHRIDRTVINIKDSPTSAGNSALQILQNSPGVDIDRVNNTVSLMGNTGVIIMLNGKPTRMDGAALMQYLEGMSANNIDKIELFTTPPANFDAQGDSGIININTIKNEDSGFNGNMSLYTGYGQRTKFGSTLALNYRTGKYYLYGDLSSTNNFSRQDAQISSTYQADGVMVGNRLKSTRPAYDAMHRFNVGIDYQLNSSTLLGFNANGYMSNWDMNATSITDLTEDYDLKTRFIQYSHEVNTWKNGGMNIFFSHEFSANKELSVDYDYLLYDNNNPTDYNEDIFESENLAASRTYFSRKTTPISFHVLKLDYSDQVSDELKVEIGLKRTTSNFENDIRFANIINEVAVDDDQLTDNFQMNEEIRAAYLSVNYQVSEKLLLKNGLRYEYNDTNLSSGTEGQLINRKRGRVFPTLFLDYKLTENQSLGMSISRRITRPSFNALAPAYYFFDRNTVLTGNPALRSIISNQIKLDYTYKDLNASLQFTNQENPISWGQTSVGSDGILVIRAEHIHAKRLASLNLNHSFKPKVWWNFRWSLGGYHQTETPPTDEAIEYFNRYFFQANITQTFDLPKDLTIDLTTNYRSTRQYGVNYSVSRGSINIGIQKTFNNQSKLSFNVNDLFDMGSFYRLKSEDLDSTYDFLYEVEGNVFRLNYSLPLGNSKLNSKRRGPGSSEERSRVN